jgi:hypothetical protein
VVDFSVESSTYSQYCTRVLYSWFILGVSGFGIQNILHLVHVPCTTASTVTGYRTSLSILRRQQGRVLQRGHEANWYKFIPHRSLHLLAVLTTDALRLPSPDYGGSSVRIRRDSTIPLKHLALLASWSTTHTLASCQDTPSPKNGRWRLCPK